MTLEQRQIDLLISYRDKAYVYAVLCEKSFELFSLIRSLCNIPLILITSVLSIINASDFDPKDMKLPNVVINACVALIMGLISNFKLNEKESVFKQTNQRMIRHTHFIEDLLNNSLESLESDDVSEVIKKYDDIVESNEFAFPSHIKKRVANIYKDDRTLPSVLNCVRSDYSLNGQVLNNV